MLFLSISVLTLIFPFPRPTVSSAAARLDQAFSVILRRSSWPH